MNRRFAQLDENNTVIRVIVVSPEDCYDKNGCHCEERGIAFCQQHIGDKNSKWVETFPDGFGVRGRLAGIGYTYSEELDAFIGFKPFESWILNSETLHWESPLGACPEVSEELIGQQRYIWSEEEYQKDNTKGWVLEIKPEPQIII